MECGFQTDRYAVQYKNTEAEPSLLWESHCHSLYEMIAVLDGDVTVAVEGRPLRLTAGTVTIVPPLAYHTIAVNKSGAYRRVTVLFDTAALPSVLALRFQSAENADKLLKTDRAEALARAASEEDTAFFQPLFHSILTEILYEYVLAGADTALAEDTLPDETLRAILDDIEAHLSEKITLDGIAARVARSKSSVCHLFQSKMQISVKQYILQKKFALAARMIRDGTPPTTAAVRIGYDNYGNFYRMYRKIFGISPEEDRQGKRT
ncbi:MAG: helix-turn-helix transcriptional regulator [Clostridia bacterium]|nr:helix-turn-helix transcriptional regulator [Clostridia bacterium]